jgi:hypothetical protein
MPASIAGTKMSVRFASNASEVMAGPGQNPDSPPANAEDRRTENHSSINFLQRREEKALSQEGPWPAQDEPVTGECHHDGPQHHKDEARIESAGEIEKVEDLGRIGHA